MFLTFVGDKGVCLEAESSISALANRKLVDYTQTISSVTKFRALAVSGLLGNTVIHSGKGVLKVTPNRFHNKWL